MSTVNKGPGLVTPDYVTEDNFNTSFRMISVYDITHDAVMTRFDIFTNVKRGGANNIPIAGDQFNAGFFSTSPGNSDLLIPRGGIIQGMAIRTDGKELIKSLRGLADELEKVLVL